MIPVELIAKVRRLFFAEHWKIGTIASQLGLHPDTVRSAIESHRFNPERTPSFRKTLTDPYLDFINQTLQQYPRLRASRIYEMIRARGYAGSLTQLRRVVRSLRPQKREAFLRLTTLPAEQAQADWAHFGKIRVGRAERKLSCFVITLSYSRALWVEFFFDQSIENLLLGHVHAFSDWGGVPRNVLFDNMRSVVSERRGDAIHFHPRLLELCAHYHFAALPCRPARGNEKGRVERAIQYIRHSFFAARSFAGLGALNAQALVWRDEIANQRRWPSDDRHSVIEVFNEEKPRLLPLPVNAFECDLIKPVRSGKTIYIRFDGNDYSIPPEAVGQPLTLVADPETVRLLDGSKEIARHRRSYSRHETIEDPAHIAAVVKDKRKALGATALSRLSSHLPRVGEFLDAAFTCGEQVSRQSKKLIELLDDYGAAELNAAIEEALERQTPRTASLALILERRRRKSRSVRLPVDLSHHPHLRHFEDLSVPTQNLEVYDEGSQDEQ